MIRLGAVFRIMSKVVVNSSILLAALTAVATLAVFLSKVMFEDARALAQEFRIHQVEAGERIGMVEARTLRLESRMESLSAGIDDANKKLDFLIQKHIKSE